MDNTELLKEIINKIHNIDINSILIDYYYDCDICGQELELYDLVNNNCNELKDFIIEYLKKKIFELNRYGK